MLNDATKQLNELKVELQKALEELSSHRDASELQVALDIIGQHTQTLQSVAQTLASHAQSQTGEQQQQAIVLLTEVQSLLVETIELAGIEKEKAKQGVLSLRQTSAGAAVYQSIKKTR